ncbi:MAG TPA: hypothetical protein O0X23_03135 [Methanocorpusculum sp.]|nr:hypothetical protein [Methanocorpusculum sp.]
MPFINIQRIVSTLLIFLLVTSVTVPAVSAGPSAAYYELHGMTHTHQSNHIGPAAGVILIGMGYEHEGNDIWIIDYDYKYKRIKANPDLDDHTLVKLRRYIESVDECRTKYDEVGEHVFLTVLGAAAMAGGALTS